MTKKELSANKLIAKFMGLRVCELAFKRDPHIIFLVTEEDREDWTNGFDNLCYHQSWRLLMPVVEKIESMGYETHIVKLKDSKRWVCDIVIGTNVHGNPHTASSLNPNSKIESVWNAVVDFLKWYNKQNKK